MNDEVRDMIGKALANEPPLRIDYDTVHAAGRRRLARRHVGILGGTALAVVALASAAVAVGNLNAGPQTGPAVQPPASDSSAPPPSQGCVVPARQGGFGSPPDGVATEAELVESARLTESFAGFAMPLPEGVTMDPERVTLCAIEESWGAEFALRSGGGERHIFLEVLPRAGQAPGECNTFGRQLRCAVNTRPDGSVVRVSESPPPSTDQPTLVNVEAWRADDTVVRVMETGPGRPQFRHRILDDDALTAIATAPELRVNWSKPAQQRPDQPSDRRAAELTAALAKARTLPEGMHARKVPDAQAEPLAFYVSQGGYRLDADLVDAAGEGHLFINLSPPAPGVTLPECPSQAGCELITLADGGKVTLTRSTLPQEGGDISTLTLSRLAADGTLVTITTRNMSMGSVGRSKDTRAARATRPAPPLDGEQLIRIATIPGLHW